MMITDEPPLVCRAVTRWQTLQEDEYFRVYIYVYIYSIELV